MHSLRVWCICAESISSYQVNGLKFTNKNKNSESKKGCYDHVHIPCESGASVIHHYHHYQRLRKCNNPRTQTSLCKKFMTCNCETLNQSCNTMHTLDFLNRLLGMGRLGSAW